MLLVQMLLANMVDINEAMYGESDGGLDIHWVWKGIISLVVIYFLLFKDNATKKDMYR